MDLRDEKTKKDYYLNIANSNSENDVGAINYDITEKKKIGFGAI